MLLMYQQLFIETNKGKI